MTDPKPYKVRIRWGSEATQDEVYEEEGEEPSLYEFATEAERDVFLLGVDEGSGWADYTVVEPDEAEVG